MASPPSKSSPLVGDKPTTALVGSPNLEITRYEGTLVENTRLNLQLYFRHFSTGASGSESGKTVVDNQPIYDGAGLDAKLIARARGIHVQAPDSYVSFVIVFDSERFYGSALEIMGAKFRGPAEWAIVGGTGYFAMARGVIQRTLTDTMGKGKREVREEGMYERDEGAEEEEEEEEEYEVQELTVDAFCRMKLSSPEKIGTWGGSGGSLHELTEKPLRLASVSIHAEGVIDSFEFSYFDQTLKKQTVGPWGAGGRSGATTSVIELRPSEKVTAVSGTVGKLFGNNVITSLTIVTSIMSYGPFGDPNFNGAGNNTPFSPIVPKDKSIVGFFGRSGEFIDSIGFYVA